MFLSLQEYCKFKNTEDSVFPSVYIGLKDKLSGIRKVIMDSTVHLVQLLHNYRNKLEEFAREGEKPPVGCAICVPLQVVDGEGERKSRGRRVKLGALLIFKAILWLEYVTNGHSLISFYD